MSTLAHTTARPPLRLLERRSRPVAAVPPRAQPAPAPSLTQRLDRWLSTLPEPRDRLGTHV